MTDAKKAKTVAETVRVEVVTAFKDKAAGEALRPRGFVYEVTAERFDELQKAGNFVKKTRRKITEQPKK